jgi:L1 cell adhesion molecule like protein
MIQSQAWLCLMFESMIAKLGFTIKAEDDLQKERIGAKNSLESYCFNIKSTLEDDNIKSKISESDRSKVMDKCSEILKWLDSNQMAETDEFSHKQKELESICNPIIAKLYQQNGMSGNQGPAGCGRQAGQNFGAGPTVEEVD